MPSTDITFCASRDCPQRTTCWRGVGPGPGVQVSMADFRAIWGDICGGFTPWRAEKGQE